MQTDGEDLLLSSFSSIRGLNHHLQSIEVVGSGDSWEGSRILLPPSAGSSSPRA